MKKNNRNLVSLALIAAIALSIPATLAILRQESLDIRISAFESEEPQNVFTSDITTDAITINWTTEKEVTGGIKLTGRDTPVFEEEATSYHQVRLVSLETNTRYQLSILSNAIEFNNQNKFFSATTASIDPTTDKKFLVYGQVFSEDGLTFQQEGLISLELSREGITSSSTARLLNEAGGFQLNLAQLLTSNLNSHYNPAGKVDVIINVYRRKKKNPVTREFTVNLNQVRQLPNVYLGDIGIDVIPGIEGLAK